jgi:DNA-binding PadR family transcriptional regulator
VQGLKQDKRIYLLMEMGWEVLREILELFFRESLHLLANPKTGGELLNLPK